MILNSEDKIFLNTLVRNAGKIIMAIFHTGQYKIVYKSDDSPFTAADGASHRSIVSALKNRFPLIPVLSEEDIREHSLESRKDWDSFWLVDPLDGTKEFIKKEKDFTVNIALIHKGEPLWGVVYAPARDWLYYGGKGVQSKKETGETSIETLPIENSLNRNSVVAARSKSHAQPQEETLLKSYGVTETITMGSSLKFCLVAEGTADIYYRSGPTWEWDTAAAHAVALGAGVSVLDGSKSLMYNKETLLNNRGFLCIRNSLLVQQYNNASQAEKNSFDLHINFLKEITT